MKLTLGQYVRHSKYGWGTFLECQGQRTTVFFNRVGVRKLTAAEAVFRVVEDEAARKRRGV